MILLNDSRKKIVKARPLECFLFSDMFVYAKAIREKKTGKVQYMVYRQVPRALVLAKIDKSLPLKVSAPQNTNNLVLVLLRESPNPPTSVQPM